MFDDPGRRGEPRPFRRAGGSIVSEAYREIGRERAEQERETILDAFGSFETLLDRESVDPADHLPEARAVRSGLPERYRAEFEGLREELGVDRDRYTLFAFGLSDVKDDVVDEPDEDPDEGCTNVVVPGNRTRDGRPLVLKNRDISGRGLRPQALVEYPPIDGHHGFVTLSSCGQVYVYQGVNEAGLVAANTFIDVGRSDVDTADRLRNGVVVRRALEECASVDEARSFVDGLPIGRMKGLTFALADAEEALLYDVDPREAAATPASEGLIVRTNHYPGDGETDHESSSCRLERGEELAAELPTGVGADDLFDVAADHRNGPGANSICRHPEADDPLTLSESTTVSATVFEGGRSVLHATAGNACASDYGTFRYGGDHPEKLCAGTHLDRLPAGE